MFAVCHAARDRVGMAHAVAGFSDVALDYETPYERRRHTQSVDVYRRVLPDLHAHLLSIAHIVGETLGAVVSEAVVVAREQHRHTILLVQYLAHELVCRELRHLRVEVEHLYAVGSGGVEQLQLLVCGGDELWHVVGMYHLTWMAVERDDERLSSLCVCHGRKAVNHKLMTAMYTVEEPDCCAIFVSHICKDTDFKANGKGIVPFYVGASLSGVRLRLPAVEQFETEAHGYIREFPLLLRRKDTYRQCACLHTVAPF